MITDNSDHVGQGTSEKTRFQAQISDESFNFRDVCFQDRKVTGAQVAEAAGVHPVENFVILQWLKTYELETIRPTELIDLVSPTKIFVIEGSATYRFVVDGLNLEWPRERVSGRIIKLLVGKDDDKFELLFDREDVPDQIIEDNDEVNLIAPGVEHFKVRQRGPLTIFVDGEPYNPPKTDMTPNEIIAGATHLDLATHYLVKITKPENVSYQGKGDEPIHLHRGMKFLVISTGATPVSDPNQPIGVQAFVTGLEALGFKPQQLPGNQNHIFFDYTVENGKFKDKMVRLGLIVPHDFPMTPPTGPYVSPDIHPINTSGPHPLGAIHKQQALPFEAGAGGTWQYWSRPFSNWATSKRSVPTYMSHISKLWELQ